MSLWRRLLLAGVCGTAVASIYVAQPMLEAMSQDLGIGSAAAGWLVTTGQLGYVVGLVLLVPLGDMVDRRRLIAGQLALTGAGVLVTGWARSDWLVFAGLAAAGLFAAVVQTTVAYAAAVSPAPVRGRTIGVVTSGVVVGILGGRVLAGAVAQAWGWQSVYVLLGLLHVGLAGAVAIALPADARRAGGRSYARVLASLGGLFKERLFWSRGLIAFFVFASFGTLWSGMALPLADPPWSLGEGQIGLFGLVGLAGALAAARAGRWADAGQAQRVTGIALALLAASWAATSQLSWSLPLLVVGAAMLDFAVQGAHVSSQHQLTARYPDRASAVIGGYMVFYSFGSGLGAAATTAAYSAGGWIASSIVGTLFAVGALAVCSLDRRAANVGPGPRVTGAGPRRVASESEPGRNRPTALVCGCASGDEGT